jgi:putative ABC transport system permease protein
MTAGPPRLAQWLLRHTLPPERYETVAGDLEEIFQLEQLPRFGARAARRWFWTQAINIASAHVLRRAARRPMPPLLDPPLKGDRMHALRHDVRYAIRALLRTPGFTFIAVLTLALGIGGSVAIFTLVQGLLLKPLPFKNPGELMMVYISASQSMMSRGAPREMPWSYPKYEQLVKSRQQSFEDHALFSPNIDWNLTSNGRDPERVRSELIDGRYLSVLGLSPLLGRDIQPDEARTPGAAPIVLLSYALWERRFGGDAGVLGRTVGLNGTPHTVVGVLPAGFRGLSGEALLFVPIMSSSNPVLRFHEDPWAHAYYLVARRKPGVSTAQAQSELAVIGARHDAAFPPPAFADGKGGYGVFGIPLEDSRTDPLMRRAVFVLLGAVGAVLLIGCVNLANLMLTRALARQREVAVRLAIGASRGQVVRQFLTESLIVAAAGAGAGLFVAAGAMKLAVWLMPEMNIILPRGSFAVTRIGIGMIGFDVTTVLFTLALAFVTALVFGLLPAWQASRADVAPTLKAGGGGSVGRGGAVRLASLLIVAETAMALVLLVAAGLMLTSVRNLQATRLGFQPDGLILSWVSLPAARYDRPSVLPFVTRLLDELRAQPGVEMAAFGSCAPVSGNCGRTLAMRPERELPLSEAPVVGVLPATPDYFRTLGIPLIKGRTFTDRDREGQPGVAVINETAARRLWPGDDPIGKRIRLNDVTDANGAEVVGVVADVRYHPVEAEITPDAYLPFLQRPQRDGFMFIRTRGDVAATTAAIQSVLRKLDAELPVVNVKTMGNRFGESTWRTRLSADLLTLFAALALLLAAIGLYGVMAQLVEQRTREIGVRMALGADRANIFRLVISRALIIGAVGVAIGAGIAMWSMRFLDALLYQVKSDDPLMIAMLAIALMAVTLLASYVPARRATRVDPLTSLRAE